MFWFQFLCPRVVDRKNSEKVVEQALQAKISQSSKGVVVVVGEAKGDSKE